MNDQKQMSHQEFKENFKKTEEFICDLTDDFAAQISICMAIVSSRIGVCHQKEIALELLDDSVAAIKKFIKVIE